MVTAMLAVAYVLHALVGIPPEQTSLTQEPVWRQVLVGVIVAPLLETLTSNLVVHQLTKRLRLGMGWSFLASWCLCAAFHSDHLAKFATAGVVGGAAFSLLYYTWFRVSPKRAFWAAAGCHALHNATILVVSVLFG